nr:peptidoglycan-binding protein [Motilibacter aurantiacus]
MSVGDEGADVRQLERGLQALGHTGFTVDDEFTVGTAAAVRAWQEDVGAVEDGVVDLGEVVFARTGLRVAEHQASPGGPAAPGSPALLVTTPERVVQVALDVADLPLARKGAQVAVELPDGRQVDGTVSAVGTVAHGAEAADGGPAADGEAGSPTVDVEVTLRRSAALAGLDGAPVTVRLESERHDDVLTVPVEALLALREGGFGVRLVEGAAATVVAVEPGAFADGRVEVTGGPLSAGDLVEVPSS